MPVTVFDAGRRRWRRRSTAEAARWWRRCQSLLIRRQATVAAADTADADTGAIAADAGAAAGGVAAHRPRIVTEIVELARRRTDALATLASSRLVCAQREQCHRH